MGMWPIRRVSANTAARDCLVVRRVKTAGHTLTLYYDGNQNLHEILTRVPELFLDSGSKTIKSEKKIRVIQLPLRLGSTLTSVLIKQHNVRALPRLASIFATSAARRSWFGAKILLEQGYATARPIAVVEYRRWGLLKKSFYLSEEIIGAKNAVNFWREDLRPMQGVEGWSKRRAVLKALAHLFSSLHQRKIYHNDLKASNILARDSGSISEGTFSLIDLQGVRRCFFLSERRRIKNLAQLNRTLGGRLTRTEKLFFLNHYLRGAVSDTKKRQLIGRIVRATGRQLIREKARHSLAEDDTAMSEEAFRTGPLHMPKEDRIVLPILFGFAFSLVLTGDGAAHSGRVDGYGCHPGKDKVSYHCHQGHFSGRSFKSKEEFLRELRGGQSPSLAPKSNQPQLEKKLHD